jgi:DNA invertase Pin-like site-specific DNA recombinase
MAQKIRNTAVAYVRTSSAANIGEGKDSEPRQREAIERFAKAAGFQIKDWFRDPAVSGVDPIESRPGFSALLDRLEANGVRTVIVEDATRLARDLMVQELGLLMLIKREVHVLTVAGDDLTRTDDPFKIAVRQIAGVFAQLEKARLVARLKRARDRKKATGTKVEGRKSISETRPELVAMARDLASRRKPRLSLLKISAALAEAGYVTSKGRSFQRQPDQPHGGRQIGRLFFAR